MIMTEAFDALAGAALNDHTAAGNFDGPLHGTKLGLIVATFGPSKTLVVGDLTEASFAGYAKVSLTWSAPFRGAGGVLKMDSGLAAFTPTDGVLPQTVYGFMLVDSTAAILLGTELLPTPIPLNNALDTLGIVSAVVVTNDIAALATIIR